MQRAVPAPHIVAGCYLFSIRPFGVGVQEKCNDTAAIAEFPALRDTGFGLQGLGIFNRKPLEQGPDDVVFGNPCHHMGIETLGLGTIAIVQYPIPIALYHVAFSTAAGGDQQDEGGKQEGAQSAFQKCV